MSTRIFSLEESLGFRVNRAARALAASLTAALRPEGLTPAQFVALHDIEANPGTSQAGTARRSGTDTATAAELLKRLEQRGLVRRQPVEGNLRRHALEVPDEVVPLVEEARQRARQVNQQALRGLSPAEARTLMELLGRVEENLR